MRSRIGTLMHCTSCVAGVAFALLTGNAAISGENAGPSSAACAAREVLLMTLVDAHGAVPNAGSDILAANSSAIMRARGNCDDGHANEGVAVFDRLIIELSAVMQRSK